MSCCSRLVVCLGLAAFVLAGSPGCEPSSPQEQPPPPSAPKKETSTTSEPKRVAAGPNVWLEFDRGRIRVLIDAYVCLREGQLEQLMCRRHTKEHEAILAAGIDARDIHKALLLAKAEPGSPVRYDPKFVAPSGTPIKVTLRYEEKGKKLEVPARKWVKNGKTGKNLDVDWVFAGSVFYDNPQDRQQKLYGANGGDVICVSNFEDAMLDLPINSSKDDADRIFEADTRNLPPLETKVTIVLEPIRPEKKK